MLVLAAIIHTLLFEEDSFGCHLIIGKTFHYGRSALHNSVEASCFDERGHRSSEAIHLVGEEMCHAMKVITHCCLT